MICLYQVTYALGIEEKTCKAGVFVPEGVISDSYENRIKSEIPPITSLVEVTFRLFEVQCGKCGADLANITGYGFISNVSPFTLSAFLQCACGISINVIGDLNEEI